MTYVDEPDKKQKSSKFEKRANKLLGEFTKTDFQKARSLSNDKQLNKGFGRIGMCLNGKPVEAIPTDELDKICFILCNTYTKEDLRLGIGPFNDSYLIALNFHKQGYKIFYLHNPTSQEFIDYLQFFLKNTQKTLTVYYSVRIVSIPNQDPRLPNTTSIVFDDGQLPDVDVINMVRDNSNEQCRVIFISDCSCGGSICDMKNLSKENSRNLTNAISISAHVNPDVAANQKMKIHKLQGLFTYYFCKLMTESPDISPERLVERLNPYLERFDETTETDFSNKEMQSAPIFM